jgi:hypothetical protein
MKVLYLSHPYRAGTEWGVYLNVQSAHFYAKEMWRRGYACISPVSNTAFMGEAGDFDKWMAGDLEILGRCDILVLCPGWERSEGCRMEYDFARSRGLKIYQDVSEVPYET